MSWRSSSGFNLKVIRVRAFGSPEASIMKAFGSIHNGGKCVVAGMAPLGAVLNIAPFEFLLGKTITGSVQGEITPFVDVPRFVDMFMEGKLPIDKLITRTCSLGEINEGFEALEKGETIRSVIRF